MEETDLSNLSDSEIINMFPDIIEGGTQLMAAKNPCGSMYQCNKPGYGCCTKPNCGGVCQVTAI